MKRSILVILFLFSIGFENALSAQSLVQVTPPSGLGGSQIGAVRFLGDRYVFKGVVSLGTSDLWVTVGAQSSTQPLVTGLWRPGPMRAFGSGKVLFTAINPGATLGRELYITDGTPAGTQLVKDLIPGQGSDFNTSQFNIVQAGGKAFFLSIKTGIEGGAWITDGTEAGTRNLRSANCTGLMKLGPHVLLQRGDTTFGVDTTTGALRFLSKDTHLPLLVGSGTYAYGKAIFSYVSGIDVSDGTQAGTAHFRALGNPVGPFVPFNGKFYFAGNYLFTGTELYSTDGTLAGTQMVTDMVPGRTGSSPLNLTVVGSRLYYTANDSIHGTELFYIEGNNPPQLAHEFTPGTAGTAFTGLQSDGTGLHVAVSSNGASPAGHYFIFRGSRILAHSFSPKLTNPVIDGFPATLFRDVEGERLLVCEKPGISGQDTLIHLVNDTVAHHIQAPSGYDGDPNRAFVLDGYLYVAGYTDQLLYRLATVFLAAKPALPADPFVLSPNPTHGVLRWSAGTGRPLTQIEIIAADGRLVRTQNHLEANETLSLDGLRAGMYIIRAKQGSCVLKAKMVKE